MLLRKGYIDNLSTDQVAFRAHESTMDSSGKPTKKINGKMVLFCSTKLKSGQNVIYAEGVKVSRQFAKKIQARLITCPEPDKGYHNSDNVRVKIKKGDRGIDWRERISDGINELKDVSGSMVKSVFGLRSLPEDIRYGVERILNVFGGSRRVYREHIIKTNETVVFPQKAA